MNKRRKIRNGPHPPTHPPQKKEKEKKKRGPIQLNKPLARQSIILSVPEPLLT